SRIVVEVREHPTAVTHLFAKAPRPCVELTVAVTSAVVSARSVKVHVDDRPDERCRNRRAFLVVQTQRDAASLQELKGFLYAPRWARTSHRVLWPPATRGAGKSTEKPIEPLEIDVEMGGQLIQHRSELPLERGRAREQTVQRLGRFTQPFHVRQEAARLDGEQ